MKKLHETDRIYLYKTKEDEVMISIKYYKAETEMKDDSLCDMCGTPDDVYYLCPELGHKGLCTNCFRSYKMRGSWYESDKSFSLNTLMSFVLQYGLTFTEEDLDLIDIYLDAHSHREKLKIRNFINTFKKGE